MIRQEIQPITRGHKTLGAQLLFEHWFSHQSSLYFDSEVATKFPTFHTAIRYRQANFTIDNDVKK